MANTHRFRVEPVDEYNLRNSMFGVFTSTEKTMKLGLQNTSNVTLKSLVFPSPCKRTRYSNAVIRSDRRKGKTPLKLLSSRHFVCC